MNTETSTLRHCLAFWGKTGLSEGRLGAKPVLHHLLDVAAVTEALLGSRPQLLMRLASSVGIDPGQFARFAAFLAGLHDLGKFSKPFQIKCPEFWPVNALGPQPTDTFHDIGHWHYSALFLQTEPVKRIIAEICPHLMANNDIGVHLVAAIAGHHGIPPLKDEANGNTTLASHRKQVCQSCKDGVLTAVETLRLLTGVDSGLPISSTQICNLSFALNGLITVSDWVGSDLAFFPIAPLGNNTNNITIEAYWNKTREQARKAIKAKGLLQPQPLSAPNYGALGLHSAKKPRPMQVAVDDVAIGEGPQLFIIEDTTGSGKTEAAMLLAARLMAAGKGEGIYFALPTMATANAMFGRLEDVYKNFYSKSDDAALAPSMVLAHGKADLAARIDGLSAKEADDEATSHFCNAWIGDSRRKAFFAEMGAGTIDQAFLAVLQKRFLTLRQFALANRILLIDEAHSFDAYMGEELNVLLQMQARNGGSAIVLSATLSQAKRLELAKCFQNVKSAILQPGENAYPLLTQVGKNSFSEILVRFDNALRREVEIGRLEGRAEAISAALTAARQGAAVAIICNAVDEAMAVFEAVRAQMSEPDKAMLFHARFAMGDRMAIETQVLDCFGKQSDPQNRAGRILVATQVIEQSLDLDFDLIISDLAPIDFLIQRAGRLWRHMDRRPQNSRPLPGPRMLVVSPDPNTVSSDRWLEPVLGKAAFVYQNAGVLWRSAKMLFAAGRIAVPDDLRSFIEQVYGRDNEPALPACLLRAEGKGLGKASGEATLGRMNVIKPSEGYAGLGERLSSSEDIGTRLGEKTTVLRLARHEGDRLVPFYRMAEADDRLDWELSEITLRETLLRDAAFVLVPEALMLAVKADWPKFEQEMMIAVVDAQGNITTDGSLTYHREIGLVRASPQTRG